jgi:hypothetical protein
MNLKYDDMDNYFWTILQKGSLRYVWIVIEILGFIV